MPIPGSHNGEEAQSADDRSHDTAPKLMAVSRCSCGRQAAELARRAWTLRFPILCDGPAAAIARRSNKYRQGRGLDACHRADEAVATPGHRLDAAALFSVLIEDAPQRRDLNGQVTFLDHRSGPDGLHDRVLRDQLPVPLGQQE